MRKQLLITICIFIFSQTYCQLPKNFDKYVDTVLSIFNVPGLSIAVVKDDKVLLAKGYGIKHLNDTAKIDAHTLFLIASNTKAFTAMALAMLVDEGKIHWDDPVINYLPWFKMSDAWVTSQITIRDLLVHHSGIPAFAGDLLIFPPSTYTRKEIIEKLKDIPIVNNFRTTYAYDNILYITAGELIATVSGMSWEDFIKTNIFDKIGMNESVSRFTDLTKEKNIATGHILLHNKVTPAEQFLQEDIGDAGNPAGGIASNATDMAKWMITELDSGKTLTHDSLIKASDINQLWKIVTPLNVSTVPESLKPSQMISYGYALGVRVYNYGKYKIISHGGTLDGFVSHVLLAPDLKLGITVLTNQQTTGAYWSIIYHLLDYYIKNPDFNWIKGYKTLLDSSMVQWQRDYDSTVVKPDPSAPKPIDLDKYIGAYHNSFYGELIISRDSSSNLKFQFSQTQQFYGRLQPFQYETFNAIFQNPCLRADGYLSFMLLPNGKVESCKLKPTDPDTDMDFSDLIFTKTK